MLVSLHGTVEAGSIWVRMQMPLCQGKHFGWRSSSVYPHYQVNLLTQKTKPWTDHLLHKIGGVLVYTISSREDDWTPWNQVQFQNAADSRQQTSRNSQVQNHLLILTKLGSDHPECRTKLKPNCSGTVIWLSWHHLEPNLHKKHETVQTRKYFVSSFRVP